MDSNQIFVVSNSHIDPVWLWDKHEGIDEVINTFRSACDRLDEYPDVRFSASSICFYKWVEEFAPDVFERIKAHVALGRWEIVGGWLVETDCNLPLVASFYRSAELSRRYVQSRFGVDVTVGYSPDTFGHPAPLPAVLSDTGFKYYIFARPGEEEKTDLPGNLFYWEHAGKRVLCYRLKHHYTQGPGFDQAQVASQICAEELRARGPACYFFGMGDHGGGPTKLEIEAIKRIQSENDSIDIRFSTCLEFFEAAEKIPDIPVYSGDLHNHAVGCYSVNRDLKNAIRHAERSLCYTQRVMVAADTDPGALDALWEKTIFNQFHDIMPGSCAPHAAQQAKDELGGVIDASDALSYKALKTLTSGVPVKCSQGEFRVYNSLREPVTGPFEIESFQYFCPGAPFKDSDGNEIAIQEISASVSCQNHRWLFVDTIPACSLRSYYFDSEDAVVIKQTDGIRYKDGSRIALGGFVVESPGQIIQAAGSALLKSPLALGVIEDQSDTWSHGVTGFDAANDYFVEEFSSVCEGSVASFLISRQSCGSSRADLKFAIYRDLPFVDLLIRVRWEHERSILKLEIEPNCGFDSYLVQGPGAAIEKSTDSVEEPLHGWVLAGDLGIVQDGSFAIDRRGSKLRITLVRSSIYGYDKMWQIDPRAICNHTDLGEHEFRLRFVRRQDLTAPYMNRLLNAFVEPMRVVRDGRTLCLPAISENLGGFGNGVISDVHLR